MTKAANGAARLTVDLSGGDLLRQLSGACPVLRGGDHEAQPRRPVRGPIKTLLSVSGLDRVATVITADG